MWRDRGTKFLAFPPRVEVWSENNVRLAVNSGAKIFHRKAPTSFSVECGNLFQDLRLLAVKIFFHRIQRICDIKETRRARVRTSQLHVNKFLFHCSICYVLQ